MEFSILYELILGLITVASGSYFVYKLGQVKERRNYAKVLRQLLKNRVWKSLDEVCELIDDFDYPDEKTKKRDGESPEVEHIHQRITYWYETKERYLELFGADFYLNVMELILRLVEMDEIDTRRKADRILFITRKLKELLDFLKSFDETNIISQIFGAPTQNYSFVEEFQDKDFSVIIPSHDHNSE